MDKPARIQQRCLKRTNCSFKKAQSGSENPPALLYVPAAASASRQADVSLKKLCSQTPVVRRHTLYQSGKGIFVLFFLLLRSIPFQLRWGHGTSCLFYTRVQMLLRNISRLGRYRISCSICGMQPGIQAAHQKPSIFSLIMTLFVSVSLSLPVSSVLALFIA